MRRIDADALKEMIDFRMWDVDDDYPHDEASNRISEDHAVKKIIDEMPTVDAVPIEWILNHERMPKEGKGHDAIMDMIADWRKENDRNS